MTWFSGLDDICTPNVALSELTTFGLGGAARWLFGPRNHAELADLMGRCHQEDIAWRLIGRARDILADDAGFDGAVIRLSGPEFTAIRFQEGSGASLVWVAGGADLGATICATIRAGLGGLEALAGIPGTVGGSVRMNAGGRSGRISSFINRILVMHPDGQLRWVDKGRVGFGYRRWDLPGCIVLAAEFDLADDDPKSLADRYRQTWIHKRQRQPLASRSAGCVFKNPQGQAAGQLLEKSGCKGLRSGGASVSSLHANFIIAEAGCTADDVKKLIETVRQRVFDATGVPLEVEIEIWPYRPVEAVRNDADH